MSLTAARLREVLSYDPLTGEFRWLVAPSNRVRIGQVAGNVRKDRYWIITIDATRYLAHRLAFLYMTLKFPDLEVDHIDCDKSNNRWDNLREANRSSNAANCCRSRRNTSGFKGVSWYERERKFCAFITINRRQIYLGRFDTPEEAHAAYISSAVKHFGEFARAA